MWLQLISKMDDQSRSHRTRSILKIYKTNIITHLGFYPDLADKYSILDKIIIMMLHPGKTSLNILNFETLMYIALGCCHWYYPTMF